jgi:hypothetical protein
MIRKPLKTVLMSLLLIGVVVPQLQATDWADSAYFSWANYYDTVLQETVNYVTPVNHDQEGKQMCGGLATAGAIESNTLIQLHKPDSTVDVAEQLMLTCWGSGCMLVGGTVGSHARGAGLPAESCFPAGFTFSCTESCADTCAEPYAWATFSDGGGSVSATDCVIEGPPDIYWAVDADSLKKAIVEHGPLVVQGSFDYDSLVAFDPDTGLYAFCEFPDTSRGAYGHFFIIYGWNDTCNAFDSAYHDTAHNNDDQPCFLVKNSWGPYWGEDGIGSESEPAGCFKVGQDCCEFRLRAGWVEWTPLAKPVIYGPTEYSAYVHTYLRPTDSTVRFTWGPPPGEPVDSLSYRLNIVDGGGNLVCSEVTTDTTYVLSHVSVGTTYSWYVRAFIEGRDSARVSDWAGSDAVEILDQPCCANRGDIDHDGDIDNDDIYLLSWYMFNVGCYPGCWQEADVDGDDDIDIGDLITLSAFINQGGYPPADCP